MGRVETFRLSVKPLKQSPRKIFVYLPDGYDESTETYPVLYMFDGHNLFFDKTATYGKCWGIKDYLDKTHLPLVVIGQDCNHTGDMRLFEYCPLEVENHRWFPDGEVCGDVTAEWFANTLKPYCESRYRIKSDRRSVGIAGSSMGGLMSLYCIAKYNHVYSKAACLSPTIDITFRGLIRTIQDAKILKDTRVYMDYGSNECRTRGSLARVMDHLLQINRAFQDKRCSTFPNMVVNGTHSEASWEGLVPVFLEYLFPELFR